MHRHAAAARFQQRTALSTWLLALLFAGGWSALAAAQQAPIRVGGAAADVAPDLTDVAKRIVVATNELRRQQKIAPLAADDKLTQTAQDFAQFMAEHDKYGHQADGHEPAERIEAHGYDYCIVEENIAWLAKTAEFSNAELADGFFQGWEKSAEHRDHLLNADTRHLGVGLARSKTTGRYFAVQEFGRPRSAEIVFEVANTSTIELPYRIDGDEFTLAARHRRRHARCTPPEMQFLEPKPPANATSPAAADAAGKPARSVHPESGDRFDVSRDATAGWRIDKSHFEVEVGK